MKVYIGILAILGFIFFQTNKNYKNENRFTSAKKAETGINENRKYEIIFEKPDSAMHFEIEEYIKNGINDIEHFFGEDYSYSFEVHLFANRELLDKKWQKDWEMPDFKSQCWMVASGTATQLDLLSPGVWEKEACEHDHNDKTALNKLIAHELVHVYQGQKNPNPDFDGMDNIGWFVEGLAVFASGQYDSSRVSRVKEAFDKNKIPTHLNDFWDGEYRYALAGSLISFLDQKYGRKKTFELIHFTSQEQILSSLNTSEEALIKDWREFFSKS